MTTQNPLLDFTDLPRYGSIEPAHIGPAMAALMARGREIIAEVAHATTPATWETVVTPLEDAGERLSRAWGVANHLQGVCDSPELRAAYSATQPAVVAYYTELGQNLSIFKKYEAIAASPAFDKMTPTERRIIEGELRDFRLAGAELSDEDKAEYASIQAELASLQTKFSENLLDATNAFAVYVQDEADLAGLPVDVRESLRAAAEHEGKSGWKLSLHMPSYLPVLQFADRRDLREKLHYAFATRASDLGPASLDNTAIIRRILALRAKTASLLGYGSFAEVSLVPKMADTPAQVLAFLEDLGQKARPFALRDIDELRAFAADELGLSPLEPWDQAYASEKLRLARHCFSDQEVKPYLPETKVLAGLFALAKSIYGVTIEPQSAETWHESVRFFQVRDGMGALLGRFYLDLFARETKRGGAWMDDAISRRLSAAGAQTPVAYLVCNFSAPVGGKVARFTHDEVITLFHEFGHGMHHLLTRVNQLWASGIHGVEWDAVELPSQLMENFCWEWEVLSSMSEHAVTGLPLPRALFDKMVAAKNFQSGMQTMRQVEMSLFDMHLHHDFDAAGPQTPMELLGAVRARVAVTTTPAYNRFPSSFSHIFAGGYSAGYYSYKWAEVLSADAFSLFEEHGVVSAEIGRRFWDEVLAVGGGRPAMASFRAFRGREPSVDALLRHSGMVGAG